jgi:V8-like Glu-specific endopeptidase
MTGIVSVAPASQKTATRLKINAVYGGDQRVDMYDVHDQNVLRVADSTVSVFNIGNLKTDGDGFSINMSPMSRTMHICTDEKFADQPTPADCSGVLISSKQILTAGHCVSHLNCKTTAFAFGYRMSVAGLTPNHFSAASVYNCENVISRSNTDSLDYAIVELDRDVLDHTPVPIAQAPIESGESIYLLSHPAGTPLKYSPPVPVLTSTPNHFSAEVDALGGSSGGAVFSADRNELVGILVSGADDYVEDFSSNCRRINQCDPGRCEGEQSTHVGAALELRTHLKK